MTKKLSIKNLKKIISEEAAALRLDRDVETVSIRLLMQEGAHVPDTLTRIRVLPTVAVVGQKEKVERYKQRRTILEIYIKFLPSSKDVYKNLMSLSRMIKSLPGVEIVSVLSYNGRDITHKGKPIVL
jgi:hypothetical protein